MAPDSSSKPTASEHSELAAFRADRAEQSLLGALLGNSKRKEEIFLALGLGECLRSPQRGLVYSICREMYLGGHEPNGDSVADRLQGKGQLERAGGYTHLATLIASFVSDAWVGQHCVDVLAAYRGRQMQLAVSETLNRTSSVGDPSEAIAELVGRLSELNAQQQTDSLEILSISELLEKEVPEMKWCVEELIPHDGFGMIAGDSGVGKTWLLLQLAIAVAKGDPWLGTFPTTQGTVLFIDEESGEGLMQDRLLKLGSRDEIQELPIYFAPFNGLKVDTERGLVLLRDTIKGTRATLVVIDSFVRIHDADENSSQEMSRVTEALVRTARENNCAIVVAHHARKKSIASNAPGQLLRGTSELKAALDVHLFVTREKTGAIRIEHEKARYGETVEPVLVELTADDDGRVRLAAAKEVTVKVQQGKAIIIEILREAEEDVLRRDLAAECKKNEIGSRSFAEALRQLKEEGSIQEGKKVERTEKGGTRTLKTFRLMPGS